MKKILLVLLTLSFLLVGCGNNKKIYTEDALYLTSGDKDLSLDPTDRTRIIVDGELTQGSTFTYERGGKTYKGKILASDFSTSKVSIIEWDKDFEVFPSDPVVFSMLFIEEDENGVELLVLGLTSSYGIMETTIYCQK